MAKIKLKHARQASDAYSSAASERTKQYAFAALAVVWILSGGASSNLLPERVPSDLLFAALFAVVVLAADFLHYFSSYAVWAWLTKRHGSGGAGEDSEFEIPSRANTLGHLFYWGKMGMLVVTYTQILYIVVRRIE